MSRTVVAIDGTAGSGKSTVAALVADRLGLVHIDTGATYRLVALNALRDGLDLDDAPACGALAARVAAACAIGSDGALLYRGTIVGDEIRAPDVSEAASRVARHPEVRSQMVALQRQLVPDAGAVIEGRDIGTVVWPDARVKVFLDAGEHERVRRRAKQLDPDTPNVLEAVRERDERDATRPFGAMRPAADARMIDTSRMTPAQVADAILSPPDPVKPNRFYVVVSRTLAALLRGPFHLEVIHPERIPSHGPAILAPNHRSLVDIPVLAALTRRKVWFMGKEELFASTTSDRILRALGGFPVRRGKPDRTALTTALDLLKRGELLGVYPEGTRRPHARFEDVEDGFTYLALKTGVPIVPIAMSGTEAVFPKERRLPKFVTIRVLIGEPFTLAQTGDGIVARSKIQAATAEARRHLTATMDELEPPS